MQLKIVQNTALSIANFWKTCNSHSKEPRNQNQAYDTVKSPNKGHFGTDINYLFREVVLFSEVQNILECPLLRGLLYCVDLGVSTIRGFTVYSKKHVIHINYVIN